MQTYADPRSRTRPRSDGGPRDGGSRNDRRRGRVSPPARRDPLWAKLLIILGAVVMVISGGVVVVPRLASAWFTSGISQVQAIPDELRGQNIDGPINFLLLGMDQRNGEEAEDRIRADSIIIAHIPATHDRVYMISIPRDARVAIPDYPKTKFKGYTTKINAAFAAGAVGADGHRDPSSAGRARGAELTMMTLSNLVPGGLRFNGVAVIDFDGFTDVLQAIGGVHLCVDEDTYSIHYKADGTKAPDDLPDNTGYHYPMGCMDMQPWQALDFSRQRHIADGDYGRQRHQQQLLKAIVKKVLSTDTLTNLSTIAKLQKAAGNLLTMDLNGTHVEDWALTLKSIRADDMVMIKTNGGKFAGFNDGSSDEQVLPDTLTLLKSLQTDTVFDFLATHQDWIATDQAG